MDKLLDFRHQVSIYVSFHLKKKMMSHLCMVSNSAILVVEGGILDRDDEQQLLRQLHVVRL